MNQINYTDAQVRKSLKWLQFESLLTVMMLSVPVYTVFMSSIGLSQFDVGLSQAIFMAVAMLFDIPSGWIADRFSRKLSNCFGDLLVAAGLIVYFFANSLAAVILAEVFIGAGLAFSNGADVALLKSYATHLNISYAKLSAKLGSLRPFFEMFAFILGGYIATINIRLTFLVTAGILFTGAIISLFIKEVGERRITEKHPIRDMYDITRHALHGDKKLKWRIIAAAVSLNVTHTVIWIFTPILLYVGVKQSQLGLAWAFTLLFVSVGSVLAHRYASKLSDLQKITIPMVASIVAYFLLGSVLSAATIMLVLIFSLSRGWFMAVLNPMIQHVSPPDIQATVVSVASLLRRFLYIPLVLIVNYLGNFSLELALFGSAIIYLALLIPVYFGLRRSG